MGIHKGASLLASGFRRDQRGAIAPIFAVLAGTLVTLIGVGLDVSRVSTARSSLQDATDAAGLALSRDISKIQNDTDLQTKADSWVKANIDLDDFLPGTVQVTPDKSVKGVVKVVATAQVQPTLSALFHVGPFYVNAESDVNYGLSHVELALVLDNTGSMASNNKLVNLKTAAKNLITTLSTSAEQAQDNEAFKVAIVPFSMAVNLGKDPSGASYETQPWITGVQPTQYGADIFNQPNIDRFAKFKAMGVAWKGCVESRPMDMDIDDVTPTSTNPKSLFVPFFAPDEPDANTVPASYNKNGTVKSWQTFTNNYLSDGVSGTDPAARELNPAKYTSSPKSGTNSVWGDAVGPNSGCNVQAMTRLTAAYNAATRQPLLDKIDAMVATGDTEIPLGLVWGWHLISPNMPFGSTIAYNTKDRLKIVVLVTDGDNTYGTNANWNASSYTSYGYAWQKRIHPDSDANGTTSPQALNDRLAKLCTAMKDPSRNLIIYAVPVDVSNTTTKGLLKDCTTPDTASSGAHYIDATSADLTKAFASIAGSISNLRIAK